MMLPIGDRALHALMPAWGHQLLIGVPLLP
jgi:hypothetical protein